MNNPPDGIKVGLLTFSYYGLLISAAVILALWLSFRRLKARNMETAPIWGLAITLLITTVIGARLWFACFPPPSALAAGLTPAFYRRSLLDLLTFWQGGFAFPGALIGGLIGFAAYCWRRRLPIKEWLSTLAPIIPFIAGIIFWGNFINQQQYGLPSTLPWAIRIQEQYRLEGYKEIETYHPLFFYQSLWALVTTAVVIFYERKTHRQTMTAPLTGMLLSIGLFLLEFLRLEVGLAGVINRFFWGVIFLLSAVFLFIQRKQAETSKL